MTKKKEIQEQIATLRERLNEIEELDFKKIEEPKLRALVGSHWKYRNSFGGDEKWWLFAKVVSYADRRIRTLEIQKTSHGNIEIREHERWSPDPMSFYLPIGEREWNEGTKHLIEEVNGLAK